MIFNMVGAAVGGVKYLPQFDSYWNLVLSKDGKSGYAEFFGSGTLTWRDNLIPPMIDVTCVGGGGGGESYYRYNENIYHAGSGGAGGVVTTVLSAIIDAVTSITVGAGGKGGTNGGNGANGGTSSFGTLCVAPGGTGGSKDSNDNNKTIAGSGGNAGGLGGVKQNDLRYVGTHGSSNGTSPPASGNNSQIAGTSQGTPTVDILGRTHAGGGAGGAISSGTQYYGGSSTYPKRSGQNGASEYSAGNYRYGGTGGGGAGGGGGGGAGFYSGNGGDGGDGLVVIGWGDYTSLIGA